MKPNIFNFLRRLMKGNIVLWGDERRGKDLHQFLDLVRQMITSVGAPGWRGRPRGSLTELRLDVVSELLVFPSGRFWGGQSYTAARLLSFQGVDSCTSQMSVVSNIYFDNYNNILSVRDHHITDRYKREIFSVTIKSVSGEHPSV